MVDQETNLPNLIVAGVPKAGSTSLHMYLSKHPDICGSYTKEINFFSPLHRGHDLHPLSEYAGHFSHAAGERYRLESSPGYLYGRGIANGIRETLGEDVRIIVVLRNPVERVMSFYNRAVGQLKLPPDYSLEQFIDPFG